MLQIGVHELLINEISFREASTGNPGVVVGGTIGDDDAYPVIWITEASAGIARRKLKLCGFDCDANGPDPMGHLAANPDMLRGNRVKVLVTDDPTYGIKVDILANAPVEASKLKAASDMLKSAKKSNTVAEAPPMDTSGAPF